MTRLILNKCRHSMNSFFKIFLFAMLLVSCGDNDPNLLTLRNHGNGPDEFALVTLREIEMPSDFSTLPAPTLGGSNLTDINPQEDVITALGGVVQLTNDTFGNDKSLEEAITRFGLIDNIKDELSLADKKFRKENKGLFLERLIDMNVYFRAYSSMTLDSKKEMDRLSELGVKILARPPNYK